MQGQDGYVDRNPFHRLAESERFKLEEKAGNCLSDNEESRNRRLSRNTIELNIPNTLSSRDDKPLLNSGTEYDDLLDCYTEAHADNTQNIPDSGFVMSSSSDDDQEELFPIPIHERCDITSGNANFNDQLAPNKIPASILENDHQLKSPIRTESSDQTHEIATEDDFAERYPEVSLIDPTPGLINQKEKFIKAKTSESQNQKTFTFVNKNTEIKDEYLNGSDASNKPTNQQMQQEISTTVKLQQSSTGKKKYLTPLVIPSLTSPFGSHQLPKSTSASLSVSSESSTDLAVSESPLNGGGPHFGAQSGIQKDWTLDFSKANSVHSMSPPTPRRPPLIPKRRTSSLDPGSSSTVASYSVFTGSRPHDDENGFLKKQVISPKLPERPDGALMSPTTPLPNITITKIESNNPPPLPRKPSVPKNSTSVFMTETPTAHELLKSHRVRPSKTTPGQLHTYSAGSEIIGSMGGDDGLDEAMLRDMGITKEVIKEQQEIEERIKQENLRNQQSLNDYYNHLNNTSISSDISDLNSSTADLGNAHSDISQLAIPNSLSNVNSNTSVESDTASVSTISVDIFVNGDLTEEEFINLLPPIPKYKSCADDTELSIPNGKAIDIMTINDSHPVEDPPVYTPVSEKMKKVINRPQFSQTGGDSLTHRRQQQQQRQMDQYQAQYEQYQQRQNQRLQTPFPLPPIHRERRNSGTFSIYNSYRRRRRYSNTPSSTVSNRR